MIELIYTSSSKCVGSKTQGYCTVACSHSISPILKINLENMSDYSWIYPPHHKEFANNPVNYSFTKLDVGQKKLKILLRIGVNGLDYSGRINKIAHFICLDNDDVNTYSEYSPIQIIKGSNTFVKNWNEDSQFIEKKISDLIPGKLEKVNGYWKEVTGDRAWAAHLVKLYRESPSSYVNIIYDLHVDPLKLISELTDLLSDEEIWNVTFSTLYNGTSLNSHCNWRFILRGSKYHKELKSIKNVFDLNNLKDYEPNREILINEDKEISINSPLKFDWFKLKSNTKNNLNI